MNISEINTLLCSKTENFDSSIDASIISLKETAIQSGNNELANVLWCYYSIYQIQKKHLDAYCALKQATLADDTLKDGFNSDKSELYEEAWNHLDSCDITIGTLEKNFCVPNAELSTYYIEKILQDIKLLQPLFPYKVFLSRETIIKEQKCSICGRTTSIRKPCGHVPGILYNGELCVNEITNFEFLNENIVTNPFDKYAILKIEGEKFDFSLLDYIVPHLAPYKSWSYTVEKRLLPQYKRIGRNEKCPCGSGLKFKRCIQKDSDSHFEMHYSFKV